jgi:hypothetical protein
MPDEEGVSAFARRHRITRLQARELLREHGGDQSRLEEAVRNLAHFLRAPS